MSNAYITDLLEAVGQSRDPAVIGLLVDASGYGYHWGVAKFGDLAASPLIDRVRHGPDDLDQRAGAMQALAVLCRLPLAEQIVPLSASGHQQIVDLATEIWHSREYWPHERIPPRLIPMTALAVYTGDPALRAHLERLATGTEAWAELGFTDPAEIARRQGFIRLELSRHPQP